MPDTEITLQELDPKKIDSFLALENKIKSRLYSLHTKKSALEIYQNGMIYQIKSGKNIVGNICYQKADNNTVLVKGFMIDPTYQRQSFGKKALQILLSKFPDAKTFQLTVHPENTAVNLYKSFGFEITERKEDCFGDGEPRVLMKKINA
jgi:ribosomal protein S18 acetylase RimI-like enzyme